MVVAQPFKKILLYTKFIIFALSWHWSKIQIIEQNTNWCPLWIAIQQLGGLMVAVMYKKDDYHFDSIQRKLITVNKKSILETQLSLKLREIWQMILNLSLNYAFRRVYFLVWHDFLSKKLMWCIWIQSGKDLFIFKWQCNILN